MITIGKPRLIQSPANDKRIQFFPQRGFFTDKKENFFFPLKPKGFFLSLDAQDSTNFKNQNFSLFQKKRVFLTQQEEFFFLPRIILRGFFQSKMELIQFQ